ncbi:unnamed protein product [Scytosiphon promiscuus]
MRDNLPEDEVLAMLTSTRDSEGRDLLMTAVRSGAALMVRALVDVLESRMLSPIQGKASSQALLQHPQFVVWQVAVQAGQESTGQTLVSLDVRAGFSRSPEARLITVTDDRGWSSLFYAVASGKTALVDAVVSVVELAVPPEEVNPIIDDCLPLAMSELLGSVDITREERAVEVLSCLIRHGAGPTPRQISLVGSKAGFKAARKCFLDAVCSAINPLLVGMRLSLLLADAAGMGNEGQRRVAERLQKEVEELVLEVFERLPQTVDGFRDGDIAGSGMEASLACSMVFTPEKTREGDQDHPSRLYQHGSEGKRVDTGPLEMALQARHQLELFCTQPLVLDFLSRAFTRGLPGLDASEAATREADEVKLCRQRNTSVQADGAGRGDGCDNSAGFSHQLQEVLEGPHQTLGSLTLFPGLQFILAQMVARPAFCYSVPAVRMSVDMIVYVLMLVLFSKEVLWYDGDVEAGEVVFFAYVLGAILVEISELWEGREEYMKDHWNALDVLALAFCGSAFLVRMCDPDSLWGRALYGAGAPLLLFRTLFFAQFMPAQGPMIEIIFSLAGELLRFCTILLVTMMGFAMSFFALFRHSCSVDSFRTYWSTSIALLRAMLGETKLFDDFTIATECCLEGDEVPSDEPHCEDFLMECCSSVESEHFNGLVGKALLAAYNVVMGIILLNLLIAVLSEAYVDVKENIDTESKVSRTLVIRHYINAVEEDMLPSPLNLVQYAVSIAAKGVSLCTGRDGMFMRAKFFAGLTLFWLVSGFGAVLLGSILWIASWPKSVVTLFDLWSKGELSRVSVRLRLAALSCGLTMPLFLAYQWLWGSTCAILWRHLSQSCTSGGDSAMYNEIGGEDTPPRPHDQGIIGTALKIYGTAGQGSSLNVQQLREFLENPMKDPLVQRDEETRETTVEHVKLLRDNLTEMVGDRVGELAATTTAEFERLETALSAKVDRVDEKLSEILRKLNGVS